MATKLWIHLNEQMNLICHNLQFDNPHLVENHLQAFLDLTCEYTATILRAPYDMIFAKVDDVLIRFVFMELVCHIDLSIPIPKANNLPNGKRLIPPALKSYYYHKYFKNNDEHIS